MYERRFHLEKVPGSAELVRVRFGTGTFKGRVPIFGIELNCIQVTASEIYTILGGEGFLD